MMVVGFMDIANSAPIPKPFNLLDEVVAEFRISIATDM